MTEVYALKWDAPLGPGCAIVPSEEPAPDPEVLPAVRFPSYINAEHNAEQAAIGAALIEPDKVMAICQSMGLQASDFHDTTNRRIFAAMLALYRDQRPIDCALVAHESGVDGITINRRIDSCMAWTYTESYVDQILQDSRHRHLLELGVSIRHRLEDGQSNIDCIAEIRAELDTLESKKIVAYRSLTNYAESEIDPTQTLLGNRFLCREGGMLFVGPSGVGKSSASVQQDVRWALGLSAFGIVPAKPLKITTIQAENDEGDLTEMARGIMSGLNLSEEGRTIVDKNTFYVAERAKTGPVLIDFIESVLHSTTPDILRLDPLQSFLGGDTSDPEIISAFVHTGLNPLLQKYACGIILNHHTPKLIHRDSSKWKPSDWQYSGAGSAVLTNWARAIIVVDPCKDNPALFRFIAAKRGWRVDWKDENEERTFFRYFRHSREHEIIFWEDASEEEIATTVVAKKDSSDILDLIPSDGAIPKPELLEKAKTAGLGTNKARGFINELLNNKSIFEWHIKRPGKTPGVSLSLTPQPEPKLDL